MENALTWDSYSKTLTTILNTFIPRHCFEWGAGKSTEIIMGHPAVSTLDSVEHNPKWVDKVRAKNVWADNLNIIYESDMILYPMVQGRHEEYNLIFIDGEKRESCLHYAKFLMANESVVILHDAERAEYQEEIKKFSFLNRTDRGHTVVLTENKGIHSKVEELFIEENSHTPA